MIAELTYTVKEEYSDVNEVKKINENVERTMEDLGAKIINCSYILSDGVTTEAYEYYEFPALGIVTTSLSRSKDLEYTFCANFLGFEDKTEEFNNIKMNLIYVLKRVGLKKVE